MNTRPDRFVLWMSLPLAALFTTTSLAGLFWPPTYAQEKFKWAVQGMAGDAVNLLVIVPVLLASAIVTYRGSIRARLIWLGTMLCILYSSIFYTLAVHFNQLFFVYCGLLGFSVYGIVGSLSSIPLQEIADRYSPRAPVKTTAVLLLLFALLTASQWLQQTIPPLLAAKAPQEVVETGLFTHPAAVLDLATLLPAVIICAVMLLRRKAMAFVLAPALIAFMLLMTLSIEGMGIGMYLTGFTPRRALVSFSAGAAVMCVILSSLLIRFLDAGKAMAVASAAKAAQGIHF